MPARKVKVVEVVQDDMKYDDVVETVTTPEPEPEPEVVPEVTPEVVPEIVPEAVLETIPEVKPKKQVVMATCEGCGKEMTAKNLKYAHSLICPALNVHVEEEVVEEEVVEEKPKPKLRRTKTVKIAAEDEIIKIPAVLKKTKEKKPSAEPSEPVIMKRNRAVVKAEKYAELFDNSLQ